MSRFQLQVQTFLLFKRSKAKTNRNSCYGTEMLFSHFNVRQ